MDVTKKALLQEMFFFEREARKRLLATTKENRVETFEAVYGEFYSRFGTRMADENSPKALSEKLKWESLLFSPLASPGGDILELGCGQAVLIRELARKGMRCVGLDAHVREAGEANDNLAFVQGNAVEPELDSRFDLVFSDQMLEHLHPEDVPRHFAAVRKLLKPNGCYAFCSPSALIGPADVSAHFGCKMAEGLHLKEWAYRELWPLLQQAGYTKARSLLLNPRLTCGKHIYISIQSKMLIEVLFRPMPRKVRRLVGKVFMLSIFLVAK